MKNLGFVGSLFVLLSGAFIETSSAEAILDTLPFPQANLPIGGGVIISNVPLDAIEPLGPYSVREMFYFENDNPNRFLDSVSVRLERSGVNGSISLTLLDLL